MTYTTNCIVYPEGDIQEIPRALKINQLTDLNGYPLSFPLSTAKMIIFRVYKISSREERGETKVYHHLELVPVSEIENIQRSF